MSLVTLANNRNDNVDAFFTAFYAAGAGAIDFQRLNSSTLKITGPSGLSMLITGHAVAVNGNDVTGGTASNIVLQDAGGQLASIAVQTETNQTSISLPDLWDSVFSLAFNLGYAPLGHLALTGGAHDDRATGGRFDDILNGGKGDDTLNGSDGNDTLTGDEGRDSLSGGKGNDVLYGGAAADHLDGGKGHDTAGYAGASKGVTVDLLNPNLNTRDAAGDTFTGIEAIAGTAKGDKLYGTNGADTLIGNGGADQLEGRGGNDTYFVDTGAAHIVEGSSASSGIDSVTVNNPHAGDHYAYDNVEHLTLAKVLSNATVDASDLMSVTLSNGNDNFDFQLAFKPDPGDPNAILGTTVTTGGGADVFHIFPAVGASRSALLSFGDIGADDTLDLGLLGIVAIVSGTMQTHASSYLYLIRPGATLELLDNTDYVIGQYHNASSAPWKVFSFDAGANFEQFTSTGGALTMSNFDI